MIQVKREALVPYSPEQMFDLVNRVRDYPDFLPWCRAAQVLAEDAQGMEATLQVSKGHIRHAFTTVNEWVHPEKIVMHLKEGPFQHLEGLWEFEACQHGCKITFHLEFEFKHGLMGALFSNTFKEMAGSLVQAFAQRAKDVYV